MRFSQSAYSVNEGAGAAQPVLVLSNPSSTDITAVVYSTNGTAFGKYTKSECLIYTLMRSILTGEGIDYGSGPYTVTFVAGQTHTVFNVPLNNDDYYEGNENFVITINSSSLLSRVTPDNPSLATVTIVDNDGKHMHEHMHKHQCLYTYVHTYTCVCKACLHAQYTYAHK